MIRTPICASLLLKETNLAQLRNKPVQRSKHPDPTAPKSNLLLTNHSDSSRYLLLDGVPVALVAAGSELLLPGLKPGQYLAVTRDFFGSDDAAPRTVELPLRLSIGD